MKTEDLQRYLELCDAATPGPWRTRYGGNFTQVWLTGTNMEQPSDRLIADINYRQSNMGENTPVQSRRNAQYIAALNPAAVRDLLTQLLVSRKALEVACRGKCDPERLMVWAKDVVEKEQV